MRAHTAPPMGTTQYYTASSLDGFIAAPGHDLSWLMQFGEIEGSSYPAFIAEVGAIAMGASTYAWVLANLDLMPEPDKGRWPYTQPTWVFTHRSHPVPEAADVRFVQGDVRPVHRAMREAAGERNVWVVGGGDLAGQFLDAGLLDEMLVQIAPVTLGAGQPLLPRRFSTPTLELQSATTMGPFVELRYRVPRVG